MHAWTQRQDKRKSAAKMSHISLVTSHSDTTWKGSFIIQKFAYKSTATLATKKRCGKHEPHFSRHFTLWHRLKRQLHYTEVCLQIYRYPGDNKISLISPEGKVISSPADNSEEKEKICQHWTYRGPVALRGDPSRHGGSVMRQEECTKKSRTCCERRATVNVVRLSSCFLFFCVRSEIRN